MPTKYEIKYRDRYGNWQHLPNSDVSYGAFTSESEAIHYINKSILSGVWGPEWAELDPEDIEVFEI